MNRLVALLVAAVLLVASVADAIMRRDDVPDAQYLALGADHAVVGEFSTDGLCTLIDPHWVVTAAHVAQDWNPFEPYVYFGDRAHRIESIVFHPSWTGRVGRGSVDMALARLATPVEGITPATLYETQDEVGLEILFLGYGMTGTGSTGPVDDPRTWRGAMNRLEEVRDHWVVFTFDAPPAALPMEGISGPGDSGGPALLERDGRRSIVGVSSSNDGEPACTYGTREYYSRISTNAAWIRATMAAPAPPLGAAPIRPTSDLDVSGGLGLIALKFFEAYNSADAATIAAFEQAHRASRPLGEKPADTRAAYWVGQHAKWGRLVPEFFAPQGDRLGLAMKRSTDGQWMTFFFLPSTEPGRFQGVLIGPLRRAPQPTSQPTPQPTSQPTP